MEPLRIFIGYDTAEPVAYHVCAESIIRNSSVPVSITPIWLPQITTVYDARRIKFQDGYPPSNGFIFSRFLTPFLAGYKGKALFVDGDMVVVDDIKKLFDLCQDDHAVWVVKHDYKTRAQVKYLGAKNEDYPRKNWSSVVMFDCEHQANQILTPEVVQYSRGEFLHRFQWLKDHEIGDLPKEWNVLADEENQAKHPKLIHYTLGTPCFKEYADCEHSDAWHQQYASATSCFQKV